MVLKFTEIACAQDSQICGDVERLYLQNLFELEVVELSIQCHWWVSAEVIHQLSMKCLGVLSHL